MLMEQLILFLIGLLLLFTRVNNILDAINHLLCTVAFLGFPLQLKTDKGPAYTSKCFKEFCIYGTLIMLVKSLATHRVKLLWNDTV